jgi:DNA-3-methyladenine glycosylase II
MAKKSTIKGSGSQVDIERTLTLADPKLGRIIAAVVSRAGRQRPPRSEASPLEALIRAVIYQRMAATAAASIYKKLQTKATRPFTARKILSLSTSTLRSAGLSATKAEYVRNLALWFDTNPQTARKLSLLSDEAILQQLTSIPGIGTWTVNVFLIFSLQRPDVVPTSDLGIRRGLQVAYGLDTLATPQFVSERALQWRPYRSIASMYLWNAVRLKLTDADLMNP